MLPANLQAKQRMELLAREESREGFIDETLI
jgi:hypothetical protein